MEVKYPFVSVVIPCRNEEKFIGRLTYKDADL